MLPPLPFLLTEEDAMGVAAGAEAVRLETRFGGDDEDIVVFAGCDDDDGVGDKMFCPIEEGDSDVRCVAEEVSADEPVFAAEVVVAPCDETFEVLVLDEEFVEFVTEDEDEATELLEPELTMGAELELCAVVAAVSIVVTL